MHFLSDFQDELSRIETAMAVEDETGGGVADLISYNQSWFSVLMSSRSDEEPTRISSSPSIHAASSPSALEPPSTLSPVVTARPYNSQRNSLSHENVEAEKLFSPLQGLRDRAVTPARHLKTESTQGAGSVSKASTKLSHDELRSPGLAQLDSAGLERQKDTGLNPPVSPLLFGIAPPSAPIEEFDGGASVSVSDPAGLQVGTDDTYELHFASTIPVAERDSILKPDEMKVQGAENGSSGLSSADDVSVSGRQGHSKESTEISSCQSGGAAGASHATGPAGASQLSNRSDVSLNSRVSDGAMPHLIGESCAEHEFPHTGEKESNVIETESHAKSRDQDASQIKPQNGQTQLDTEHSDGVINHDNASIIVLIAHDRDGVSHFHQSISHARSCAAADSEAPVYQLGMHNIRSCFTANVLY